MRYQHALLLLTQVPAAIAVALPESTAPEYGAGVHSGRDLLGGILGEPAGTDSPGPAAVRPYTSASSTPPKSTMYPGSKYLVGLLTDPVLTTASSTEKVDPTPPAITSVGITSFASSSNASLERMVSTSTTRSASYSSPTAASTASTAALDTENNTWKIIGIAFIATLIIAIAITSSMFFDRWWKVAQEIVCCKGRPDGLEEFVPDREKQTWEVGLGGHERGYDQRASLVSVREMDTSRKPAEPTLPPSTLRIISPSDPRELPWDADNLHECALHRQVSSRSS